MMGEYPRAQVEPSILRGLRQLAPEGALTLPEAVNVSEAQAEWLLDVCSVHAPPVPSEIISGMPGVMVMLDAHMPQNTSGSSHWSREAGSWIILLNASESATRRRFTLMHEWKHVIDHGRPRLRADSRWSWAYRSRQDPNEWVANYFAGCVLMPRELLKAAWMSGVRSPRDLAALFDVSVQAVCVRLNLVGLTGYEGYGQSTPGCHAGPTRYQRTVSRSHRPIPEGAVS
jgi:Zn-dependent peptidase ImmA (M78 family)